MKARRWLLKLLPALVLAPVNPLVAGSITFAFSGIINFQERGSVSGMVVGDEFQGSYTFDSLTPGQPFTPFDNSLDTEYWAVTSWSVTIPAQGLTFGGSTGEIGVGNEAWHRSDRYIVTMFPDAIVPFSLDGPRFRFFQIDLFDFGFDLGADLLSDSTLPLIPPDVSLSSNGYGSGRFVFDDAAFHLRVPSLVLVPEPSMLPLLSLAGLLLLLRSPLTMNRRQGDNARSGAE